MLDKLLGPPNVVWVEASASFPFDQDPKDSPILSCAWAGKAQALVTGDQALLALGEVQGIPILSARAFLTLLEPGPKPPL